MDEIDLTDDNVEKFDDLKVVTESDTESLIRNVIDIVKNAKSLPLSTSVRIEREEVLELLDHAVNRFPDELRQARWMLKEREEFLAKVHREGDELLASARSRAEQMVQRTEIVRESQRVAQKIVDDANEDARKLRLEAEDYCDQKLAAFQIILERTQKTVAAGREKLRVTPLPQHGQDNHGFFEDVDDDEANDGFFDQDNR
jgi:hypothetical protein